MRLSLFFVLFLLASPFALAQSYVGHTVDNYAGIHGVIYNPANIVSSKFRADINLVSASTFGGSDYFSVNISDVFNGSDGFDFDEDTERFPRNDNNFFTNVDILGPSVMFNINPKSSIGLVTRVRGIFNLNNINGELYESVINDFDTNENFNFDSPNLVTTVHTWAEIGLSYGRILISKPRHLLTGGVTLKYLQGAGALFASTPGLSGQFTASTETLQTTGVLNYGSTQGFDVDDVEFNNLTSGFGLDLGFVYEWHPNRDSDETRYFQDPYKLKIGVSITDIGSINYERAEITSYDLNASVSTTTFEDDIEAFLDNNYNATQENQSAKVQLPTALHLLADYRMAEKWLISAQADLSMVSNDQELSNRMINTFTLTPRLETKWFSFYAPFSLRQYGDIAFGGGFRFGPLTVGSGSVFTNLLSDSSRTTDIFVGLKIPLYRK